MAGAAVVEAEGDGIGVTDSQLFWLGIGLGATGFGLAIAAILWPHLSWLLEQRRRNPFRRPGSIFEERQ